MWTDQDPVADPPTLLVGLGNPILRDDGVGWRVVAAAEQLARTRSLDGIEFACESLGGLALMERLVGYDRAIIVDAIQTRGGVPGALHRLTLGDLPTLHANSAHDASLAAALELGRRLGARLPAPQEITIVAVEAENVLDFGEDLSPPVAASVGRAAELVLAEVGRWQAPDPLLVHK